MEDGKMLRTVLKNAKGEQHKICPYNNMMMPYEKPKSLPDVAGYPKPGISHEYAANMSDNEVADAMQKPGKHYRIDLQSE